MPKLLIYKNWIFIMYGTDINENRKHVHVGKKSMTVLCKIWLEPNIEIAEKGELTIKEQNEVLSIVNTYSIQLAKQWDDFVSGKKVTMIIAK